MPRSDRLLRLLHAMRGMAPPITAARLAAETDVSLRSLYRDIDALRAAGARIEGERGYGYRLEEDPALPPQMFDPAELEVLALGIAEVRSWGDPVLSKAAGSLLSKIAARLPEERERQLVHAISHVFRPEPRYDGTLDLTVFRDACAQERALWIRYQDRDGQDSERTILPLALVYLDHTVTVLAWCCLREDFRMFHTTRMVEVRPEAQSFRPRRVTLLRDYMAQLRARPWTRSAD